MIWRRSARGLIGKYVIASWTWRVEGRLKERWSPDGATPDDAALVLRLAKLTDDHGLDLQEILDAPTAAGAVRSDVRVPAAQLADGIEQEDAGCLAEEEFEDPGDAHDHPNGVVCFTWAQKSIQRRSS